jgi:hypothetical protein
VKPTKEEFIVQNAYRYRETEKLAISATGDAKTRAKSLHRNAARDLSASVDLALRIETAVMVKS